MAVSPPAAALNQPHDALAPTDIGARPGQVSSHVEPPEQFSEQLPVHVMWHVAPPEQSTLALSPTVISHDDVPVHFRLHDLPHDPLQSFASPRRDALHVSCTAPSLHTTRRMNGLCS
jgi:hypothetical protein